MPPAAFGGLYLFKVRDAGKMRLPFSNQLVRRFCPFFFRHYFNSHAESMLFDRSTPAASGYPGPETDHLFSDIGNKYILNLFGQPGSIVPVGAQGGRTGYPNFPGLFTREHNELHLCLNNED
ncbi:hypothetical protein ES703_113631 [subsurface metagenome]